ncbi:cellulose binding domain-containing protein [Microbispora sp. RL4-1S]|uniref:Cellulose binding domain-containing protein n=1 Tax=Microbispora oryzae TaxID=2806554 RepID=A0A940WM35_9ACTN|nr:cellulose binding domain-containing protein [Microbispora oryzae]MBP2705498.1 cellulose binding domain-containing protein [Microbispora oryzae]
MMSRNRSVFAAVAASVLLVLGTAQAALSSIGESASVAAAATGGCGKAPALASGSHTITSGGQSRSYILRVPAAYDNNHPYRLIFGFHWNGGTANDVDSGGTDGYNWSYYGLRRLADNANNSTIFVAPQGIGNGWANSGGRDVTFVDDMLQQIEAALCVDTAQIFSSGFSYGGAMSYALACARPTVFRAVAVYSGANLSGCSGGTQPVGYMGLHGLRDNVLPISSGRSLRDTFVRNNGCTPQNPPEPAQGSLTHIVTYYSGCRAGYPVVWAAFDGAGHDPGPRDGCTCDGWQTWTSGEVWKFFTQFQSTPPMSPSPSATPSRSPSASPSASPSVSPSVSPSASPSTPVTGACSATIETTNSWPGGFQSNVTVRAGSSAINGWTVKWTWTGGQTISQAWSGDLSTSGSEVTVRNVSYNGSIAAGGSTSFGFLGNGSAATPTVTCTSP